MTETRKADNATLHIFETPVLAGAAAAHAIACELRERLALRETVRMIFAAAPSQAEMLRALTAFDDIAWQRVEAFHMDEYIGLPSNAPQRFGNWLTREFFSHVPLGAVHLIEPGLDPNAVASNYAAELSQADIDIVCLGIGMNGHLAFNDPPADFAEAQDVRIVALSEESRMQQVNEGLFTLLDDVPTHALTLSIPRLLHADKLFCCASGEIKTTAVTQAFSGQIDPGLPASILRRHGGCSVYLDAKAAAGLTLRDQ